MADIEDFNGLDDELGFTFQARARASAGGGTKRRSTGRAWVNPPGRPWVNPPPARGTPMAQKIMARAAAHKAASEMKQLFPMFQKSTAKATKAGVVMTGQPVARLMSKTMVMPSGTKVNTFTRTITQTTAVATPAPGMPDTGIGPSAGAAPPAYDAYASTPSSGGGGGGGAPMPAPAESGDVAPTEAGMMSGGKGLLILAGVGAAVYFLFFRKKKATTPVADF